MARLAFCVVVSVVAVQFLMRIMAAATTGAPVVHIEAFAVGQPIGLEADIVDAKYPFACYIGPSPVALPAKVGDFLGIGGAQFLHRLQRGYMLFSRTVAAFALNAGHK